MQRFLIFFFCTALLYGCDSITSANLETSDALIIDNQRVDSLDEIKAEFIVTNKSDTEKTYSFSSGCQFGFKIENRGDEIYDSRNHLICTAALTGFTLQPGESKTFSFTLENAARTFKENDRPIYTGKYRLIAFLLNDQGPETSAEFEIMN